jgi:hypothetical protein
VLTYGSCGKKQSTNSRFISYNFTQTTDIKFLKITDEKRRVFTITHMTFAEVIFQNLLTEFKQKLLQWLGHVKEVNGTEILRILTQILVQTAKKK